MRGGFQSTLRPPIHANRNEIVKAAFHTDAYRLEVCDTPTPTVTDPDHVLLRVAAVGICGSDKHDVETPPRVRQIPGHEFSGVIAELGTEPGGFRVGDRVLARPQAFCGECDSCRRRPRDRCEAGGVYGCRGSQHPPGAMAEYILVRTDNLTRIPDHVSLEEAAMVDPLAVAIHAINLGPEVRGQACVVMGAGVIGLLLAQVLALKGASTVALVDVVESHLQKAAELGDFVTLMGDDRDALVPRLESLCSGVYYELAGGDSPTLDIAIQCIERCGSILLVSQRPKGCWLNYQRVMGRQLTLQGVAGTSEVAWQEAVELISNSDVAVSPLISHQYPLEKADEALDTAINGDSLKVMIKPNGDLN